MIFEIEQPGDELIFPLEVHDDFVQIKSPDLFDRIQQEPGEDPVVPENPGEKGALDSELDSPHFRLLKYCAVNLERKFPEEVSVKRFMQAGGGQLSGLLELLEYLFGEEVSVVVLVFGNSKRV